MTVHTLHDATWTPGSLRLLRRKAREGFDLYGLARQMGATPAEVDKALWTLLGRSEEDASALLNGRRA